jgi:hypothetical protein
MSEVLLHLSELGVGARTKAIGIGAAYRRPKMIEAGGEGSQSEPEANRDDRSRGRKESKNSFETKT